MAPTIQPRPIPYASNSIYNGADLLMTLIENEKMKAIAEIKREYSELDTRFAQFRDMAALKCQEYADAAQAAKDDLAKASLEVSIAKKETSEANASAAQAKTSLDNHQDCSKDLVEALAEISRIKEEILEAKAATAQTKWDLEHFKSMLESIGIVYDSGTTLTFHGEWAVVLAGSGAYNLKPTEESASSTLTPPSLSIFVLDPVSVLDRLKKTSEQILNIEQLCMYLTSFYSNGTRRTRRRVIDLIETEFPEGNSRVEGGTLNVIPYQTKDFRGKRSKPPTPQLHSNITDAIPTDNMLLNPEPRLPTA